MGTLIFKLSGVTVSEPEIQKPLSFYWWRPGLKHFIPPGKRKKYFVYWLFHYFRIFKNRDYSALFVKKEDLIVGSMLIVPAHLKWPFMRKQDLQFTYVMTNPEYRGQGIGSLMLQVALQKFYKPKRTFWYVTDTENIASQKLCEKNDFKLAGQGLNHPIINKIIHLQLENSIN